MTEAVVVFQIVVVVVDDADVAVAVVEFHGSY